MDHPLYVQFPPLRGMERSHLLLLQVNLEVISASEVTSGAGGAVVGSTATGASICTAGTIVIGFTEALGVVPLADSAVAEPGSLGIEFARLGAGSGFGLGGSGGDLGLLLEPVMANKVPISPSPVRKVADLYLLTRVQEYRLWTLLVVILIL